MDALSFGVFHSSPGPAKGFSNEIIQIWCAGLHLNGQCSCIRYIDSRVPYFSYVTKRPPLSHMHNATMATFVA